MSSFTSQSTQVLRVVFTPRQRWPSDLDLGQDREERLTTLSGTDGRAGQHTRIGEPWPLQGSPTGLEPLLWEENMSGGRTVGKN